jgi:hypothetical protein
VRRPQVGGTEKPTGPGRKSGSQAAPASGVTSRATSRSEHGGAEWCPLADPSEARGHSEQGGGWWSGGFVLLKRARSRQCLGSSGPRSDLIALCVSVAGGGGRPVPRGMEKSEYLGHGAGRFAESGTRESGSGLTHAPVSPRSFFGFFLPHSQRDPCPWPCPSFTGSTHRSKT